MDPPFNWRDSVPEGAPMRLVVRYLLDGQAIPLYAEAYYEGEWHRFP